MIVAHDRFDAREHPLHRIRQLVGGICEASNWRVQDCSGAVHVLRHVIHALLQLV